MADESRVAAIIDEEGRLFGIVNIVDALVVLVLLAVVVAGVALVASSGSSPETRYATIDAGIQPDHIAGQISEGDEWVVEGSSDSLTVIDVYKFGPVENADGEEGVNVLLRARINGTAIDSEVTPQPQSIEFNGEPLRFGRSLEIATTNYVIEGEVTDVSQESTPLETESVPLVVEAEVDSVTADSIQAGDEFRIDGDPILTVESVTVYATQDASVRRVMLGLTADARSVNGAVFLGDQPLRTGTTIPVQTTTYELEGTVIRRGSLEEPGVPVTRTVTVVAEQVRPTLANAVAEGMTETVGGEETARIVNKTSEPAEIVSSTSSGFVVEEHPRDQTVELTIQLSARELTDGTLRFRGKRLQVGQDLRLEFGTTTFEGEVRRISN
jgi:hypothetical protein